ncbi:MAG: hypothetical protein GIS02_02035 [Methanosarcinales archaeon]|uniref:Uncharacterized protein n=1 Tax=Candidatus Ethanoperedens thermophilum TaxID=2766897 RepID=A0A848D617_9EURY|nr:hypothetical protein [Candidatus Ethanoperedens thermophilum]
MEKILPCPSGRGFIYFGGKRKMKKRIVALIVFVIASVIFMPLALCAETWKIDLNITSESGPLDVATFGIAQNATDGFDTAFDDFQAPIPPAESYMRAYFYYPSNPEFKRELTTSYIAPVDLLNWSLQIEYKGSGSTNVTITWSPVEISNYTVLFHAQSEDISMSESGSYTFAAEPETYTFNITAAHITITPTPTPTPTPAPTNSGSHATTTTPQTTPQTTINQTETSVPAQNTTTPSTTPQTTPQTTINQTETSVPAQNTTTPTPTPTEETQPSKIPGFEYTSVIIGLLIVISVMKRRRNL